MEKFTPYEKLSKKKKRELDAGRRTVWAISPVTRRPDNPKVYNRKKAQKREDDSASVFSLFQSLLKRGTQQGIIVSKDSAGRRGEVFYESSLYPAG